MITGCYRHVEACQSVLCVDACTEQLCFVELELPIACYKWMGLKLQDDEENVWGVLNPIYLAVPQWL